MLDPTVLHALNLLILIPVVSYSITFIQYPNMLQIKFEKRIHYVNEVHSIMFLGSGRRDLCHLHSGSVMGGCRVLGVLVHHALLLVLLVHHALLVVLLGHLAQVREVGLGLGHGRAAGQPLAAIV